MKCKGCEKELRDLSVTDAMLFNFVYPNYYCRECKKTDENYYTQFNPMELMLILKMDNDMRIYKKQGFSELEILEKIEGEFKEMLRNKIVTGKTFSNKIDFYRSD